MARGVRASRSPMNSDKRVTSGGHGAHLHKCPASPHGNYLPRLGSAHPPIEVKSFGEATQGHVSQCTISAIVNLSRSEVRAGLAAPAIVRALCGRFAAHPPVWGGNIARDHV